MADHRFAYLTSTTNRPGARLGPSAIRRASHMLCDGWHAHFDAHCDTWPDHAGEPSGHGTWVAEAVAEGLVAPRLTVQFGIRSPAERSIGGYIDCLDPAYAPGTGTPEPGGLSTAQVMTLLEELAGLQWVGMDLCEVAPPYDHAELTSNAAATLIWTYLCGRIASHPG